MPHIPGPWFVRDKYYIGKEGICGSFAEVKSCFDIAPSDPCHEANALLIAAAPELLDVCEDALLTFNCFARPNKSVPGDDACECAGCEIARKTRAVIAKAKGSA